MIVMKFGGSSVESAAAIRRVAAIVRSQLERQPVVVVSALGRTTTALLSLAHAAVNGGRDSALQQLAQLRDFHRHESGMERTVDEHFQELAELVKGLAVLGELTPRSLDAIASFGERLSSLIVTSIFQREGMRAAHLDARQLIVTDRRHTQATPLYAPTFARLTSGLASQAPGQVAVLGGFIGATEEGVTTTLGRGGSDFTAAIVGAGLGAEEIQIWTDVDGMLTCDPTLCPGGHRIKVLSFNEAAELAYFGAKVLHPATVLPAMEKNIPVLIRNSRCPEMPGTRIVREPVTTPNVVKSIACKRGIVVMNVRSLRMFMAHGFLRRIFEVFDHHATPVDMISTSEVSVSLTIDPTDRLAAMVEELRQFSEVTVREGDAIICVVGENIRNTPGIAARAFSAIRDINVTMVSQGASSLNLGLVVAAQDAAAAVQRLHEEFFRELDPAVFDA